MSLFIIDKKLRFLEQKEGKNKKKQYFHELLEDYLQDIKNYGFARYSSKQTQKTKDNKIRDIKITDDLSIFSDLNSIKSIDETENKIFSQVQNKLDNKISLSEQKFWKNTKKFDKNYKCPIRNFSALQSINFAQNESVSLKLNRNSGKNNEFLSILKEIKGFLFDSIYNENIHYKKNKMTKHYGSISDINWGKLDFANPRDLTIIMIELESLEYLKIEKVFLEDDSLNIFENSEKMELNLRQMIEKWAHLLMKKEWNHTKIFYIIIFRKDSWDERILFEKYFVKGEFLIPLQSEIEKNITNFYLKTIFLDQTDLKLIIPDLILNKISKKSIFIEDSYKTIKFFLYKILQKNKPNLFPKITFYKRPQSVPKNFFANTVSSKSSKKIDKYIKTPLMIKDFFKPIFSFESKRLQNFNTSKEKRILSSKLPAKHYKIISSPHIQQSKSPEIFEDQIFIRKRASQKFLGLQGRKFN